MPRRPSGQAAPAVADAPPTATAVAAGSGPTAPTALVDPELQLHVIELSVPVAAGGQLGLFKFERLTLSPPSSLNAPPRETMPHATRGHGLRRFYLGFPHDLAPQNRSAHFDEHRVRHAMRIPPERRTHRRPADTEDKAMLESEAAADCSIAQVTRLTVGHGRPRVDGHRTL
eukprot:scaffold1640_cov111-Isochrysis_galbana.AAC.5